MKALVLALLLAVAASVHAQPRLYSQAELDALLAPIALYPDPLLSQVLIAATYPDDVREAAAWSRANAHLKGDDAVRAALPSVAVVRRRPIELCLAASASSLAAEHRAPYR